MGRKVVDIGCGQLWNVAVLGTKKAFNQHTHTFKLVQKVENWLSLTNKENCESTT